MKKLSQEAGERGGHPFTPVFFLFFLWGVGGGREVVVFVCYLVTFFLFVVSVCLFVFCRGGGGGGTSILLDYFLGPHTNKEG